MTAMKTAPRLPFAVPALCFGTSGLGDMPDTYGYAVGEARADATLAAIFAERPAFLDTSRIYGMGRSEERIGKAIKSLGGLPEGSIISTKLDRDFETGRFDGERARRSLEESLTALGLDRIQIMHLHDPEHCWDLGEVTGKGGALEALVRMKEEGLVEAIGLAMGKVPLMRRLLGDWEFDAIISHNRFTLLNREADELFDEAHGQGTAVFNAAPYSSGILAKGSGQTRLIAYHEASEAQLEVVRRIEAICERHGIAMGAAALQFSMRDSRVTSTICGVTKPERVAETNAWAEAEIPAEAWDELMALPFSKEDPEASRVYRPG
ncbi:aldo/keto reductase [Aureimonas leprariae]|uniref:Aldo/keto reductase n=1 Tax=Plantimonas leprariae TaxID=2615207 RepID=A0A7V7PMN3_9HYPH|nr:aldo/keto reductase [Aureimonas leprariae]KAB0678519.1 aldo/keto reductase [Aureimonas leprariae]